MRPSGMRLNDSYTLRARVAPVVLAVLPLWVVLAAAVTQIDIGIAKVPAAALIGSALVGLVGELGRDRGRRLQAELWKSWGGAPSTVGLRWRGPASAAIVRLRHGAIQIVVGDTLHLPASKEEEENDAVASDEVYEAAAGVLRGRTRNARQFPLLFKENVSYGFRRNVLGLRRVGFAVSLTALALTVIAFAGFLADHPTPETLLGWVASAVVAALAVIAWRRVNSTWVRVPADAYAERLFEAAELLATRGPRKPDHLTRANPSSTPNDLARRTTKMSWSSQISGTAEESTTASTLIADLQWPSALMGALLPRGPACPIPRHAVLIGCQAHCVRSDGPNRATRTRPFWRRIRECAARVRGRASSSRVGRVSAGWLLVGQPERSTGAPRHPTRRSGGWSRTPR